MTLGDELLRAIQKAVTRAVGESKQTAFGVVTDTSPLTVRFNGDTVGVEGCIPLSGYTPTTSDEVLLVRAGSDWMIVGDY